MNRISPVAPHLLPFVLLLLSLGIFSCKPKGSQKPEGMVFQKSSDGSFDYCMVKDSAGTPIQQGDMIEVHWRWFAGSEQLQSTYALHGGPMPYGLPEDSLKTFFDKGLALMSAGDSLVARFPVDINIKQMVRSFNILDIGDTLTLHYHVVGVMSKQDAELQQKRNEARFDSLESFVKTNKLAYMKRAKEMRNMTKDFAASFQKNPNNTSLVSLPTGIKLSFLEKGTGPVPGAVDYMAAYVCAVSAKTGEEMHNSYELGVPIQFFMEAPPETDAICPEWKQALRGVPEGSKVMLMIPISVCPSQAGLAEDDVVVIYMEVIGVIKQKEGNPG